VDDQVPDAPRHVVFRLGESLYGLPLESVREVVVPRPPFVRVPRAPGAVRGAMNLRGRVVAVVDLAKVLGVSLESPHQLEHVVMLDRARRALGFSVGPVLGV
jgi:purine-binding chemotaxis protein CheW